MVEYITYSILVLVSVVIFITSFGILRTSNTLQKLHFTTIIDIVCFPLIFLGIILTLGGQNTRLIYGMIMLIILSPISAYFMGKLYYTLYKHQMKSEENSTLNKL